MWGQVNNAISEALLKGDLILRSQLKQFETNIAEFVGVKHAVGVANCTDALTLSLKAAGVGAGDEVVTVSYTFIATLASIVHAGATPVLIDVAEDMNMDTTQLEDAVTPRTKAVMPVHLNGRMCRMDEVMRVAEEHDLTVVEDAAQSLGATFKGKQAGAYGVGCFSLYPAKILGCAGDGGFITTDNDELAEKIRLLRDHSLNRETGEIVGYGFNSRLDNVQAAILNVKLPFLQGWIKRRRGLAELYNSQLKNLTELTLPPFSREDVFQSYVVQCERRDELKRFLGQQEVETMLLYPTPNHHHPELGLTRYKLPVTERLAKTALRLPLYPEMTAGQVRYVCGCVHNF